MQWYSSLEEELPNGIQSRGPGWSVHLRIHSFTGHLVEPFDNMRSNLDVSRPGHPLSKPSPSGDAWLAAIGLEQ